MLYAFKLKNGAAKIIFEKPDNTETYVELKELPKADEMLKFDSTDHLYFENMPLASPVSDPLADLEEMVIDQEYRIILLELGVI